MSNESSRDFRDTFRLALNRRHKAIAYSKTISLAKSGKWLLAAFSSSGSRLNLNIAADGYLDCSIQSLGKPNPGRSICACRGWRDDGGLAIEAVEATFVPMHMIAREHPGPPPQEYQDAIASAWSSLRDFEISWRG